MPGRRHLPQETRWQIMGMNRTGMSCRAIAENLNINHYVVSRLLSKHAETGQVRGRPRWGRPKKTTGRDDRALLRLVRRATRTLLGSSTPMATGCSSLNEHG